MQVIGVFAAFYVSDLEAAVQWYAKLLGRDPDHHPMETMVQWVGSAGGVQLFLDPGKAGFGTATIVNPDLAEIRGALEAAGLELGAETRGDFGAVADIRDPDGNVIHLAEPPTAP